MVLHPPTKVTYFTLLIFIRGSRTMLLVTNAMWGCEINCLKKLVNSGVRNRNIAW